MPDVVKISQLYDKNIFANVATNVRSLPSMALGKILRTPKKGDRIGIVQSHVNGYINSYSEKDGSIWLMMYPVTGENSGKSSYVKFFPDMLDWKSLKQQGVKTVEEEEKEKEEKEKSTFDKALEGLGNAGKWFLIAWVAKSALENKGKGK